MKRSLLLFVLAACGADLSADPLDISAAPLRIELPQPVPQPFLPISTVAFWGGGDRAPIYERLYLRGFKFRDVGPWEPVGGSAPARATVEYNLPIIEKVRGAVFYDFGFVNRGEYDFSTANVNSDAGSGVRLDLPIGPVRLDYGIPIQADSFTGKERYSPNLDAPGPGYREQLKRLYGP